MSKLVALYQEHFWEMLVWSPIWEDHPTGDGWLSKLPSSNTLSTTQLLNSLPWEKWGRRFPVSALASGESQQTSG